MGHGEGALQDKVTCDPRAEGAWQVSSGRSTRAQSWVGDMLGLWGNVKEAV